METISNKARLRVGVYMVTLLFAVLVLIAAQLQLFEVNDSVLILAVLITWLMLVILTCHNQTKIIFKDGIKKSLDHFRNAAQDLFR